MGHDGKRRVALMHTTPVSRGPRTAAFGGGCFERLQAGDTEGHDAVLTECIRRAAGEIDVAVLAQASMARAEARLARELPIPVFGSLRLAALRVRELMGLMR